MPRHVALLRGINVGGHRKVPMARLRSLLESLGDEDVRTYVQSGNVVLTARERSPRKLEQRLEVALEAEFGFAAAVLVRSRDELADLLAADPLGDVATDPARHHVLFLGGEVAPEAVEDVDRAAHEPDVFVLRGREIFLWTPEGVRDSKLARTLTEKRLGVTVTARNWRTVGKLLELADAD